LKVESLKVASHSYQFNLRLVKSREKRQKLEIKRDACVLLENGNYSFQGNIQKNATGDKASVDIELDMSGYTTEELAIAGVVSLQYKIKPQIWDEVDFSAGRELGTCEATFNVSEILSNKVRKNADKRFAGKVGPLIKKMAKVFSPEDLLAELVDMDAELYGETTVEEIEAVIAG